MFLQEDADFCTVDVCLEKETFKNESERINLREET